MLVEVVNVIKDVSSMLDPSLVLKDVRMLLVGVLQVLVIVTVNADVVEVFLEDVQVFIDFIGDAVVGVRLLV